MRWADVRKQAGLMVLAMLLAMVSGCGAAKTGPQVSRLPYGRPGFIIEEKANLDARSRDEFKRAVALLNGGNDAAAIDLLTRVIGRSPGVSAPYIDLAMAYQRTGRPDLAEQHLKTALGLVPNHPVASNAYGMMLRRSGRFTEAREIYEKAIADFPDYLPARRNLGVLCDLYLNDPACALGEFELYSEGMPADDQVKIWVSELRIRLGRK